MDGAVVKVVLRQGVTEVAWALYPELIKVASGTVTGLSPGGLFGPHSIITPKRYVFSLRTIQNKTNDGRFSKSDSKDNVILSYKAASRDDRIPTFRGKF